jgi:hypothetical protein
MLEAAETAGSCRGFREAGHSGLSWSAHVKAGSSRKPSRSVRRPRSRIHIELRHIAAYTEVGALSRGHGSLSDSLAVVVPTDPRARHRRWSVRRRRATARSLRGVVDQGAEGEPISGSRSLPIERADVIVPDESVVIALSRMKLLRILLPVEKLGTDASRAGLRPVCTTGSWRGSRSEDNSRGRARNLVIRVGL